MDLTLREKCYSAWHVCVATLVDVRRTCVSTTDFDVDIEGAVVDKA